jgi:hypothetical protein
MNKPMDVIKIDADALWSIIKALKLSVRRIAADPRINRSEKTIRRYVARGEMPLTLVQSISDVLRVDKSEWCILTTGVAYTRGEIIRALILRGATDKELETMITLMDKYQIG